MYRIEYDENFPGFRLELNGNWIETYSWVSSCLDCIASRENLYIPKSCRGAESHMLAFLLEKGVDITCEDW